MSESFENAMPQPRISRPVLRELPAVGAVPVPPHAPEAEIQVLGACLADDGATLSRCLREKITSDAFFAPANALIFQVLSELYRADRAISIDVLAEELRQRRNLDAVGGFAYLVAITDRVPTTAQAGFFIEKVREKWVLRKLLGFGRDLVEEIANFTTGLEDFASRHALRLQRVADFVTRMNRPDQAAEAADARSALAEILAGKVDKSRQLTLGTAYSDQILLPLDVRNEDWLNIVCGPPSGGKSSHMRQLAGKNLERGKRGAIFLLETGKRRWHWALAANYAGLNLREILENPDRVPPDRLAVFRESEETVGSWIGERLWLFDDVFFLEDIERTIRELDRTLREKDHAAGVPPDQVRGLDFVVVDYLQLVPTRERINKREEQVAYLSRSFKRLFKTLNISGILGAQLNRKPRDEERRPRLSDLRESGAIEQDADCVLAVHTPSTDRAGAPQDGDRSVHEVELIQLKRRNGPANVAVDLLFFKPQTRFQDAVRKGEARPGTPKPATGYKRPGTN